MEHRSTARDPDQAHISEAQARHEALLQDLLECAERGQDTAEALQALKQVDDEIARLRAARLLTEQQPS
ncbi:hypothetical protein GCM10008965_42520 [Methylorubrum aminovorans]